MIGFFGTDPNDLNDLGAEIEFYIDGERNVMNQTFLAFIPAGVGGTYPSASHPQPRVLSPTVPPSETVGMRRRPVLD